MIKSMGVELEGGFEVTEHPCWEDVVRDGSVIFSLKEIGKYFKLPEARVTSVTLSRMSVGEIRSPGFITLDSIVDFVKDNYPSMVNKSCGFHVHIMLENTDEYALCMEKLFFRGFFAALRRWGIKNKINKGSAFWHRLNGENTYCQKKFLPNDQLRSNDRFGSNRYTAINFPWHKHKTIEFRVLPMFSKKELATKALEFIYTYVNSYIKYMLKKKVVASDYVISHKPRSRKKSSYLIINAEERDNCFHEGFVSTLQSSELENSIAAYIRSEPLTEEVVSEEEEQLEMLI